MARPRVSHILGILFVLFVQHGVSQAGEWDFDVSDAKEMERLEKEIHQLDQAEWAEVATIWAEKLITSTTSVCEKQAICRLFSRRPAGRATDALGKCLRQDDLTEFAAEALIRAAGEGNSAAKAEILESLNSLQGMPLVTLLKQLCREGIGEFPESLQRLRTLSKCSDSAVRKAAMKARAASGRLEEAKALASLWQTGDESALEAVVQCLPGTSSQGFGPLYQSLAQDITSLKPTYAHAILRGLAASAPDLAVQRAVELLLSESKISQGVASHFLMHADPSLTEPHLLKALKTSVPDTTCWLTMDLLGRRRSQRVFETASSLYKKQGTTAETRARLTALMCRAIPADRMVELAERIGQVNEQERAILQRALVAARSEHLDADLLELVKKANSVETRIALIGLLERRGNPSIDGQLLMWLHSDDFAPVREEVLDAISQCGGIKSIESLLTTVEAKNGEIDRKTRETIESLCAVADTPDRDRLVDLLIDGFDSASSKEATLVYLKALVATGEPKALDYLNKEREWDTTDQEYNLEAVDTLAQWPNLDAAETLLSICQDTTLDQAVRVAAYYGLMKRMRQDRSLLPEDKLELLSKAYDAAPTKSEQRLALAIIDHSLLCYETYDLLARAMEDPELATSAARSVVSFSNAFLSSVGYSYRSTNNERIIQLLEDTIRVTDSPTVAEGAKRWLKIMKP